MSTEEHQKANDLLIQIQQGVKLRKVCFKFKDEALDQQRSSPEFIKIAQSMLSATRPKWQAFLNLKRSIDAQEDPMWPCRRELYKKFQEKRKNDHYDNEPNLLTYRFTHEDEWKAVMGAIQGKNGLIRLRSVEDLGFYVVSYHCI